MSENPASLHDDSILAIDIGSVNTRVALFTVVDNAYRLIASASAPSTANAPFCDIGEGIHHAIQSLQEVTGQVLIDSASRLIIPEQPDGSGVDRLVVTISAGPPLRLAAVGLLPGVSLESIQRLADSISGRVVESLSLNDRRLPELQVDALIHARPDLILLAGGTERGASRSVLKMVDLVSLALRILPAQRRPQVVYSGNQALAKRIKEGLEGITTVHLTPNIRPTIDVEDLNAPLEVLSKVVADIRAQQIGGLGALTPLSSAPIKSTAYAFNRMVRFLSRVYGAQRAVLGVDLGGSSTVITSALGGHTQCLNVLSPFGMGEGLPAALAQMRLAEILQWLPFAAQERDVRNALWQKSALPGALPLTDENLAIEQATAREILRLALRQTAAHWRVVGSSFDPILVNGAVLTRAATLGQSLLLALDGIQPLGISNLVLDTHSLLPSIGAAAEINPLLPVQMFETGMLTNLGCVINLDCRARRGAPVLRVRLEYEDGGDTRLEIKQGSISRLPLRPGQAARIHMTPLRGARVEGWRDSASFRVVGGALGAVVDARGRPIQLPADPHQRIELLKTWALAVEENADR